MVKSRLKAIRLVWNNVMKGNPRAWLRVVLTVVLLVGLLQGSSLACGPDPPPDCPVCYKWSESEQRCVFDCKFEKCETCTEDGCRDAYAMTIEECDVADVKKYKILLPGLVSRDPNVCHFCTLVCSSKAGYSVVSVSTADGGGRVFADKTWRYGLINDIYLPLQMTEVRFDRQTGNLDTESTSTFIDQKANHPISEEVFAYKNLGLQEGDIFKDRIAERKYVYRDGELVDRTQIDD